MSTTAAKYYTFGVGSMKLTQIWHLLAKLSIPTIPPVISNLQSLIASVTNRIYRRTAVAQIGTKKYLAADCTRDGEINLSYIRTAKMLADCFI
jgi:hypothetical protein